MTTVRITGTAEAPEARDCAIYCRTSMEEPDSLDRQEAACRAWCAAHGLEVAEVFREVGSGSTPLGERPEGGRLLEAVRRGEVGRVVVYSLNRLARSARSGLADLQALEDLGVRAVFVKENLDTETATGRLFRSMMLALAEWETATLAGV